MADPKIIIGQRYKASASYIPNHGDEIRLVTGQVVSVLHSYDDGWVLGKNESTNETGLLPGNFLAPMDAPEPQHAQKVERKVADKRKSSMHPMATSSATTEIIPNPPTSPEISSPGGGAAQDKNGPRTVATFAVSDFPSGLAAGPLAGSGARNSPQKQPTVSDQEEASRKLADLASRQQAGHKVPSNIGTLRLLFVGDSGIGKSSLIRCFSKTSEVVETTTPKVVESYAALPILQSHASTIPVGHLHIGEEKLNISFLEPPGFGSHTDAMRVIRPTVEFNNRQFQDTDRVFHRDASIPNTTIMRFLNAGTGAHTHVDVCLYAVLHRIKAVDLEYMRQLAPGVVLIPVILKSDTMTPSEVFALKASILEELWRAGVEVYGFGLSHAELIQIAQAGVPGAVPFAVTNISQDHGAQHHPSMIDEFDILKNHIFYRAHELRQQTAEKFVNWRATHINS
ncbi:Septin-domain-containing protein [Powellomyces hirtus]|nr:Septin-domain-containing protein [Powellomyces hirtus]